MCAPLQLKSNIRVSNVFDGVRIFTTYDCADPINVLFSARQGVFDVVAQRFSLLSRELLIGPLDPSPCKTEVAPFQPHCLPLCAFGHNVTGRMRSDPFKLIGYGQSRICPILLPLLPA